MLENKFYSMPAKLLLRCEDNLKKYLEDDLNLFENCFELPLTKPINVEKQFNT